MHVVVIIPTYNERDNIIRLIPALEDVFRSMEERMSILVVDDNSPDGTAEAVREVMRRYDNVEMITGRKEGLGRAYIKGMRYALEVMGADAVMEMDADFSHKPEDVPRLVQELAGYDFVIGSRYVAGGKIPDSWSLYRKMTSRFGNICARHIAGIPVRDCTAGFRAIRAGVLRKIGWDAVDVDGYCFQVTLLHHAILNGAAVREVPVEFVDRTVGESKLSIKDIIEFILEVWMIRLYSMRTFIKFAVVGLSGVAINLGALTLLIHTGLNKYIASPISIELSIIWNFFWNHYWTFKDRKHHGSARLKGVKFNIVSLISLAVSYSIFILILWRWPDCPPQLAQATGIIPATLVNYFFNVYWTFKVELF